MRLGSVGCLAVTVLLAGGCSSPSDSGGYPEVPESSYEIAGNGTLLIDMTAVPELSEVGGVVVVHNDDLNRHITIAQPEPDRFVAASGICAGSEAAPLYHGEAGEFGCPAAGDGATTVDGQAVEGQSRPLQILTARREGPILVVDLELGDHSEQPSRRTIVGDTDYYRDGPQQSRPADGTLPSGTQVVLLEDAGSYSLVQTMDGAAVYVPTDSLHETAAP